MTTWGGVEPQVSAMEEKMSLNFCVKYVSALRMTTREQPDNGAAVSVMLLNSYIIVTFP
jgi:hypothetical protein